MGIDSSINLRMHSFLLTVYAWNGIICNAWWYICKTALYHTNHAEVAEWQTRMVQDHVPARVCEFDSRLRHQIDLQASKPPAEALIHIISRPVICAVTSFAE